MGGAAALSTAGQRRQDRGQSWAGGTLYARSMGGHGTRYPQQGRGPGTSTAASNYAKLAPARGAWSCLPAASSACCLFLLFRASPLSSCFSPPVHTPSTPAVHPPCFPLVVSPASTESASCGLERHAHFHSTTTTSELLLCQPFRLLPPCYRSLGLHPCHASDSSCELSVQHQRRRQQSPTTTPSAS